MARGTSGDRGGVLNRIQVVVLAQYTVDWVMVVTFALSMPDQVPERVVS